MLICKFNYFFVPSAIIQQHNIKKKTHQSNLKTAKLTWTGQCYDIYVYEIICLIGALIKQNDHFHTS